MAEDIDEEQIFMKRKWMRIEKRRKRATSGRNKLGYYKKSCGGRGRHNDYRAGKPEIARFLMQIRVSY
jgi:hypothetical protein